MARIVRGVDTVLGWVLAGMMAALVACVAWQVLSRYVLASPSTVTDELARLIFIWLAMLGSAYTLGQRRHLAISLLAQMVPPQRLRPLNVLLVLLIMAFAGGVMIYGGARMTLATFSTGQVTPTLRLPGGYLYLSVPIAGGLILFYCLAILRDIFGPEARGPTDPLPDPVAEEGPVR